MHAGGGGGGGIAAICHTLATFCLLAFGRAECESWCSDSCTALNGNVQRECNDCKASSGGCYPGATGYDDWESRTLSVEVDAGGGMRSGMSGGMGSMGGEPPPGTRGMMTLDEARAAGYNVPAEVHAWVNERREMRINPEYAGAGLQGAPKAGNFSLPGAFKKPGCDLWRIDVRKHELTREMIENAEWPFMIDGLTTNWTNLRGWEHEAILRTHGDMPFHLHHTYNQTFAELLSINGKYHMGHAVYPAHACYSDPWRPYSPFLFDQIDSGAYHVPPYFHPMSTFQVGIGRGLGVGVPPENHPSSWFACVVGRKRWLLHPDTEKTPPQMTRTTRRDGSCIPEGKTPTTLDCLQEVRACAQLCPRPPARPMGGARSRRRTHSLHPVCTRTRSPQPGEVIWVPNYCAWPEVQLALAVVRKDGAGPH